jgi:hypothetical protein
MPVELALFGWIWDSHSGDYLLGFHSSPSTRLSVSLNLYCSGHTAWPQEMPKKFHNIYWNANAYMNCAEQSTGHCRWLTLANWREINHRRSATDICCHRYKFLRWPLSHSPRFSTNRGEIFLQYMLIKFPTFVTYLQQCNHPHILNASTVFVGCFIKGSISSFHYFWSSKLI